MRVKRRSMKMLGKLHIPEDYKFINKTIFFLIAGQ